MTDLPIAFGVSGRIIVVVGGGQRALPKIKRLVASGARVRLVSPELDTGVADLVRSRAIDWRTGRFEPSDVENAALVFSATGVTSVDEAVAEVAVRHSLPVNVVDRPDLCSFTMPAIVDRAPVMIAISTGGAAPILARQIRARIEAMLPTNLGHLARFADRFRATIRAVVPNRHDRQRLWQRIFDGEVANAVLRGDEPVARKAMLGMLNSVRAQGCHTGSVAIVGAGPGDADLLTLRALHFLERADVVIHDRLVGADVLDRARRDAVFVPVGKRRGHHSVSQSGINALIADHAAAGRRVVRLKGGDPFLFGRGGEELEYLRARNIAVEVVPGITAATGCAASVGMPLTHRDFAHAVTLISGEGKDGPIEANWAALADPDHTVGVYMGIGNAGRIATKLIAHGRDPNTPIAIIENGTLPNQRLVRGRLSQLEQLTVAHDIKAPAFVTIGAVAAFAGAENPSLESLPPQAIAAE
jgi:uroporphyrin-III C-methyltransferase/precorrin-2 dehydrogenase/sirohydrochlorin ferrochelatase